MKVIKAIYNQNIIDFCLQHCGSIDALQELCEANDISKNHFLTVGEALIVEESFVFRKDIRDYLKTVPDIATGDLITETFEFEASEWEGSEFF